jgi:4-amino-4-deoxy-L-arabinose transferase-like glycosyltransferase
MNLFVKRFLSIRMILISMSIIQLFWIFGIWVTHATDNLQKLLILGAISILGFLLVGFLGTSHLETIGGWIDRWADNRRLFLLTLFVVILVSGVFYARYQRVWPFDEVLNYKASHLIAEQGLEVFFDKYALNNYLGNRHPPLIFLINGLALSLFLDSLTTVRMVSLAFSFGMLVVSFYLASSLFGNKTGVLTVIFLASYPLIFRESTAGLLDVQGTFFYTLSLLLAWKLAQRPSWLLVIALGISLGLGFLTKYMLLFIIPVLVVFFLFWRNYRVTLVPVLLSFSLAGGLLLLWAWYGSQIGVRLPNVAGFSPSDLFASQLAANAKPVPAGLVVDHIDISPGYFLTSEWGRGFLLNSLLTRLPSGLGAYNLPLILLGLWLFLTHKPRRASDWYVLLWIGMTSLLLILTLPDHRYFMVIFPAFAVAMARWMETQPAKDIGQVTLLAVIYQIGTLYLMVDWSRSNELFVK